ncbi:MAG: hypothetical protein HZB16_15355 [Armatimonadetes bacterium]|nr:hypothetical protein [Armatimonadota bacterium]
MRARAQSVLYYADDKDILDLLESSKQKLTTTVLREFLLGRGILVSDQEPREEIVRYLATVFLDWPDLRLLLDHTDTNPRAERVTFAKMDTSAGPSDVVAALEVVKASRAAMGGEVLTITRPTDGVFELTVSYSELDASKTRLAQRRLKEGTLVVSRCDGGYSLRHEANPQLQALADEFLAQLPPSEEEALPPAVRPISLLNVVAAEARTAFFTGMMRSLDRMVLVDVTQVSLHRAHAMASSAEAEPRPEADMPYGDAAGDDAVLEEALGPDVDVIGLVKNMVLRGQTVLASREYTALTSKFYVCGATWESEEQTANGVRVAFEARFGNEADCTEFCYQVRGIYPRSQRNDGQLLKTHRACDSDEQRRYQVLLERAAEESIDAILAGSEGAMAREAG